MGIVSTFPLKNADQRMNEKASSALVNGWIWVDLNGFDLSGMLMDVPPIASYWTIGSATSNGASKAKAIVAFHISSSVLAVGRVDLNSIKI
jgi:hypothetical protein